MTQRSPRAITASPAVKGGCIFFAIQGALAASFGEARNCRAKVGFRVVEEFGHERIAVQNLLNDAPLDALAAAMDQADLAQTGRMCGVKVFIDDRRDIGRREGVKIKAVFDRNADRIRFLHDYIDSEGFS